MLAWLHSPLWRGHRLNRTTPFHFLVMATLAVVGLRSYYAGYTYEGSLMVYLVPTCVLGLPYLLQSFRVVFVPLATLGLLPLLIIIQNGGVDAGNWSYPDHKIFLMGSITPEGQGPFGWTRLMWTGVSMPTIEYLFYPLMGCFMLSSFALFIQLCRPSLRRCSERGGRLFLLCYFLLSLGFVGLRLSYEKPVMDHNWYLICLGLSNGWAGLAFSRSFRNLTKTMLWWWWLLLMGCVVQPLWEFGHSCLNHDWIYDSSRTMPTLYEFNEAPISVVEVFGYFAVSVTFPAIICLASDFFPGLVKQDRCAGFVPVNC